MKTKIFKIFILALFLGSCSSSNDDIVECTPIDCQNGGVFENCECLCPEGYTGIDCGSQITPYRIKVTKIRVKYFPNTNNGSNWDLSDAPDIFVQLAKGSGSGAALLYQSSAINNVLSDGVTNYDFIPTTAVYITNPLDIHSVLLGDYDSVSANDFMGGFTFTPYASNNGFPSSILLQNTTTPLSFELFLTYEF